MGNDIEEFVDFQYGYFFENDPLPKLKNKNFQTSNDSGSELPSADFLLENVAKIERKSMLILACILVIFTCDFFLKKSSKLKFFVIQQ